MCKRTKILIMAVLALLASGLPTAQAGVIGLSWNPSATATGYQVYYGIEPGVWTNSFPAGGTTQALVNGLTDCVTWYFAVSATNIAGESPLSSIVGTLPRPDINAASHDAAMQGSIFTLELSGANFEQGALLTIDNPGVILESVNIDSCNGISALATVEALLPGVRPAQVGAFALKVTNPNGVHGARDFEVLIDPSRFNVNTVTASTQDRLDGLDLVWLSQLIDTCTQPASPSCGSPDPRYNPDYDFDGDGWVDGDDLAYLASGWAGCWDGSGWSEVACPENLR